MATGISLLMTGNRTMAIELFDDEDPIEGAEGPAPNEESDGDDQAATARRLEASRRPEREMPFTEWALDAPRSPRAAFCFGHLSRRGLIAHHWYSTRGHEDEISEVRWKDALWEICCGLEQVCQSLSAEFDAAVRRELESMLSVLHRWFTSMERDHDRTHIDTMYRPKINVFTDCIWSDLAILADRALPSTSPLKSLYAFGAEVADYHWKILALQPLAYEIAPIYSWPDIVPLLRSMGELPGIILRHVPLLESLSRLSEGDTTGGVPAVRSFVEVIESQGIPFDIDDDDLINWGYWNRPWYTSHFLYRFYEFSSRSIIEMDFDIVARDRETVRRLLRWDSRARILYVGKQVMRELDGNATNIMAILRDFEVAEWYPIKSPRELERKDPQAVHQARKVFKDNRKGSIQIDFRIRGDYIDWYII
jgi:hypothetical protein